MFFNKRTRQLEREIVRLEQLVKAQEVAYNQLVEFYDKEREKLQEESRNQPVAIDFRTMNAFSVERLVKNDIPHTIIGYKIHDRNDTNYVTQIREWSIYCNDKIHKDIVKQFEEYMNKPKDIF